MKTSILIEHRSKQYKINLSEFNTICSRKMLSKHTTSLTVRFTKETCCLMAIAAITS